MARERWRPVVDKHFFPRASLHTLASRAIGFLLSLVTGQWSDFEDVRGIIAELSYFSHLAASSAPEPESDCLCPERMFCLLWNAHERQRAVEPGPPADPEDRLRGAASTFVIVRGTENLPVMVGTITLPRNARLELEKIEDKTFKPGEYVPIVNRDKGHGLIYMTAIQANSTNSDFIQGCCARAHHFAPSLYLSRSMVGSPPRLY